MNEKRTLSQRLEARKWIGIGFFLCFSQLAFATASGPATLQGVSPALGSLLGGAKVTISGHALYLPEKVTFGGVPAINKLAALVVERLGHSKFDGPCPGHT